MKKINKKYKMLIFSDIHGNNEALKTIMEESKKLDIDEVVFLGDAVGKGAFNSECIDILNRENVTCILGNNEYFLLNGANTEIKTKTEIEHLDWVKSQLSDEHLDFIRSWDEKYVIELGEYKIQFSHFLYGSDGKFLNLAYLKERGIDGIIKYYNSADYVIFGHEHDLNLPISDGFYAVGSSGCSKDELTHYTLLTYDNGEIKIEKHDIKYDRNAFIENLKKVDYPLKEYYEKTYFEVK